MKDSLSKSSLSKLYVTFKDGNKRTFHSRADKDRKQGQNVGVQHLKSLVLKPSDEWRGRVACAIIYCKISGNPLWQWVDGVGELDPYRTRTQEAAGEKNQ